MTTSRPSGKTGGFWFDTTSAGLPRKEESRSILLEIISGKVYASYMKGVRKRTLTLVTEIPPDRVDWRLEEASMSPAQVVHHIAATEKALWGATLTRGRVGLVDDHEKFFAADENNSNSANNANNMTHALEYMTRVREENSSWWKGLNAEDLDKTITGPTGKETPLRRWLMLASEHEIHHRGILHAYRKLWGLGTVPLYDQTLESLRENLDKLHGGA